jgi:hypothetical protein
MPRPRLPVEQKLTHKVWVGFTRREYTDIFRRLRKRTGIKSRARLVRLAFLAAAAGCLPAWAGGKR